MNFKRIFKRNKAVCIVFLVLFLLLLYYLYLHRHPRTDNAFVVANIRPVSAFVPGHITDIYIENNQVVKKGDKLFTVFTTPYKLKVKKLQNELKAAKYNVEALKHQLKVNELEITAQLAKSKDADYLANQAIGLYEKNAVAQKHAEKLDRQREYALTELDKAKANLKVTQEKLKNYKAQTESLAAELEEAELNLELTTVYADSNGLISNMYITEGVYANAGEPLFSFVDDEKWWIQANLEETVLAKVREGDKVWIRLWLYPDIVFEGKVSKIAWNVNRQMTASINYLPEVQKENEWFLLPQRFPVQIEIINHDNKKYPLHVGASATVVIDTSGMLWRQIFWNIDWW